MTEFEKLVLEVESKGVAATDKELKELEKTVAKLIKAKQQLSKEAKLMGAAIGGAIAGGAIFATKKLFDASRQFQDVIADLKLVTGTAENARLAFDVLNDLDPSFSIEETTHAFVELTQKGLVPGKEALIAYQEIAAATGLSLTRVVDLVTGASQGQLRGLRELGITAKQEGDKVIFSYRGVETQVKATSQSVQRFLTEFGQKNFAGTLDEKAKTLSGTLRKLHDEWDDLWVNLARQGPESELGKPFEIAAKALEEFNAQLGSGQLGATIGNWVAEVRTGVRTVATYLYTLVTDAKNVATGMVENFSIEWDRLEGLAAVTARHIRDHFAGVGVAASQNTTLKEDIANVNRVADAKHRKNDEVFQHENNLRKQIQDASLEDIADQREASLQDADIERQIFEDQKKAREQNDPLAGFGKGRDTPLPTGRGGSKGGGRSSKATDMQRELAEQLTMLEQGLVGENAAIATAYEERKRQILANTALTEQEKKNLILQTLAGSLVTEEEAINQSYQHRKDFILNNTTITEEAKTALMLRLTQQREKAIEAIEKEAMTKRLDAAATFFGNIASIGSTFGKEGFEIAKAASIAQATIKTYEAATAAYASLAGIPVVGPALGAAAAAAAIVAGAANIAQIKAQTYQGAFALGGSISSGKFGLVGERGPELVRGPAVVTSATSTANMRGTSGVSKVTIHNNGQPVTASTSIDGDELMIVLKPILDEHKRRTKSEIATDIHKGGNPVSQSMERSYGLRRSMGGGG